MIQFFMCCQIITRPHVSGGMGVVLQILEFFRYMGMPGFYNQNPSACGWGCRFIQEFQMCCYCSLADFCVNLFLCSDGDQMAWFLVCCWYVFESWCLNSEPVAFRGGGVCLSQVLGAVVSFCCNFGGLIVDFL